MQSNWVAADVIHNPYYAVRGAERISQSYIYPQLSLSLLRLGKRLEQILTVSQDVKSALGEAVADWPTADS
jgi:hypothetical protein